MQMFLIDSTKAHTSKLSCLLLTSVLFRCNLREPVDPRSFDPLCFVPIIYACTSFVLLGPVHEVVTRSNLVSSIAYGINGRQQCMHFYCDFVDNKHTHKPLTLNE